MNSTVSTRTFLKRGSLEMISEDDNAKAEFLLPTLPPFYRTNSTDSYSGTVKGLIKYGSDRQKGCRTRNEGEKGNKENPVVVFKTEERKEKKDSKKICDNCIGKGWAVYGGRVLY